MIKTHFKKCETCNFTATSDGILKTHKQEEHGILYNSIGFMMTNNTDEEAHPGTDEQVNTNTESSAKKRKTKCGGGERNKTSQQIKKGCDKIF